MMDRRFVSLVCLALLTLFVTPVASGQRKSPDKKAPAEKESFAVVSVDGKSQVIASSGVSALKKRIAEEDKEAMKAYNAAKAEAKKSKAKFTKPQPKPRAVKVIKTGLKTREEADALAEGGASEKAHGSAPAGAEAKGGFVVIEVEEGHRVIEHSALADLKKRAAEEYKTALKEWTDAKAAAKKSKADFADAKPTEKMPKVVGKTFKTEDEARAFAETLEKKN